MMGSRRKIFIVTFMTLLGMLIFPFGSFGQVAVKVSPLNFEYEVSPGEKITGTISIANSSNQTQKINLFTEQVEPRKTEDGGITFLPVKGFGSPGRDFSVEPKENLFELKPDKVEKIKFVVTVPENIEPGEHYKGLSVEVYPSGVDTSSQIITGKITVPVIIKVRGDVIDTGKIIDFKAAKEKFDKLPLNLNLTFENTGNVSYPLNGVVYIRHEGKVMKALKIEDKRAFPGQKRTLGIIWEKYDEGTLPEGDYLVFGKITYGLKAQRTEEFQTTIQCTPKNFLSRYEVFLMPAVGVILLILLLLFLRPKRRKRTPNYNPWV